MRIVGKAEVIEEFFSIPASQDIVKKVMLAEMQPFRIMCKSSEERLEEGEQFGVESLVFLQSSGRFKSDYRYCTPSVFHDGCGVLRVWVCS